MREALFAGRARGARLVVTLAVLLVAGLVAPGQAAANHYARSLPTLLAPQTTSAALAAPVQWCGNDTMSRDRFPDAVGSNQIHVVYAYPADRPNRLPELASRIATDLAAIDEWWRRNDPVRAPRYDTFPFPGCAPGFGQLDISAVQLAGTAAQWADAPGAGQLAGDALLPHADRLRLALPGEEVPRLLGRTGAEDRGLRLLGRVGERVLEPPRSSAAGLPAC